MTTASFRKQQEELEEKFAKKVTAFYSGSLIGFGLIALLYILELMK